MSVLVTGASGFLGRRALAPLVQAGCEVHAVARTPLSDGGVTWHEADLLDAAASAALIRRTRPELLIHLAWCVDHERFWSDPANSDWVAATKALGRDFFAAGGRRIVGIGTGAEYDWSATDRGLCNENRTPCRPGTPYGRAKHAAYEALSALARAAGASLAWGRVFWLFGAHEHPDRLVPTVVRACLAGESVALTSGVQRRDFMDTRDAGAAVASLALSEVQGAVNIGSGEAMTVAAVANEIGGALGCSELIRLGSIPDRQGEPATVLADVERLRSEVGFRCSQPLAVRLRETVDWWRAQDASSTDPESSR